ncbi:MAG: diguanylate cyclase [Clostridia bacterium]|nr:diguanylate cyclase [Clostridia bacterium]
MNTGMLILLIIVILLIGGIAILLIKTFSMNEKIKKLKITSQKVNSLTLLQNFMEIIGNNLISSSEKINKINNILIEKYEIKYSTIVIFDGVKYKIEASNVNNKHWETFENLHSQDIFMESIKNATPKYITVDQGEKLPYLHMEFERAKSAIFFPMYADNICIGYWLIEGNQPHEFDNIDTTILEVINSNLISAIRTIKNQRTLENLVKIDETTGLYTYEYLYSKAIKTIDKYPTSIVSLVKIINLQQIEEKISKKTADAVIKQVTQFIKTNLSPEYFCIKYNENTLAIVFSGSDADGVGKFLEDIKNDIEKIKIKTFASLNESMNGLAVAPKLNIAMKTYYKQTALEEIVNVLNKYLKQAASNESDITCL